MTMPSLTVTPTFTDLTVPAMLAQFASTEPAPGGGSAAALAGSLAGSLGAMVGGLTEAKPGYEDVAEEARSLRLVAQGYQDILWRAAELDATVYNSVSYAYKMAKETDEEKAIRSTMIQSALQSATRVPLEIAGSCVGAGRVALKLLAIGNKNASSDAATAVLLAIAGAEAALLNVAINLGSLQDAAMVAEVGATADALWADAAALRAGLWPAVKAAGLTVPR